MPRVSKGGKTYGGRGGSNRLAVWVYSGREGPGDQVKVGKTEIPGQAVEAGGSGRLSMWIGNPRP